MVPATSRSAIEIVSSNLLTDKEDTAMIWRGPILSGVIRQFYEQVLWSDLDYLLIDLPPGTSDAPLTVLQSLSVDGVVLVTMPQRLATMIVRKAANLIHQLKKPIVGVVENMSYFAAPDTGKRYDVFGPSYADQVAELAGAPMLARIPIDPRIVERADAGRVEEIDEPWVDELTAAFERARRRRAQTQRDDLDHLNRPLSSDGCCSAPLPDSRSPTPPCAPPKPWPTVARPRRRANAIRTRYGATRRALALIGFARSAAGVGIWAFALAAPAERALGVLPRPLRLPAFTASGWRGRHAPRLADRLRRGVRPRTRRREQRSPRRRLGGRSRESTWRSPRSRAACSPRSPIR